MANGKTEASKKLADKRLLDTVFAEVGGGPADEVAAVTSTFLNKIDQQGIDRGLKISSAYNNKSPEYLKAQNEDFTPYEQKVYDRNKGIIESQLNDPSTRQPWTHFENVKAFGEPYWAKGQTDYKDIGRQRFYNIQPPKKPAKSGLVGDVLSALNPFGSTEAYADEIPNNGKDMKLPPIPAGYELINGNSDQKSSDIPPIPEGYELARDRSAFQGPDYQGGALSPANLRDQQAVKAAQANVGPIAQAGMATKAVAEPAGVIGNSALLGIPGIASELATGGNLVNPLTHGLRMTQGGTNIFDGGDMSSGQKLAAGLGGGFLPTGAIAEASGLGKAVSNIVKYAKPKNQINLAEEVQNGLLSAKKAMIEKYGSEYEKIIGSTDKQVSIEQPIKNFVDNAQSLMQNPEFVQQIAAKDPQANRIFDLVNKVTESGVPEQISATEANNLSKYINNLSSIKTKLNQGRKYGWHTVQWTNEDRMLVGLADDLKATVIDAHPELGALNKDYGTFMNAYKSVAPEFRVGTTIDKLKNYGGIDPQKRLLFESIMNPKTVEKIKDFDRANTMSKVLKTLGIGAAGAAGAGAVGKAAWELTGH